MYYTVCCSCTPGQIADNWHGKLFSLNLNDFWITGLMDNHLFTRRMLLVIALLGLTASLPVQAVSLYKWVDENGRVHYSQTPPDTSATQSEQMQVREAHPYQSRQKEDATEEEGKAPSASDEAVSVIETRKRNCEAAKQNLEVFKNSERVQQPDGTIITPSEEMRTLKIKEAQALINAYCN